MILIFFSCSLCVLRAFLRVLSEPFDCTVKGFTKDTKGGTKDTKKYSLTYSLKIKLIFLERISVVAVIPL